MSPKALLTLTVLPDRYAICRLDASAPVPEWAGHGEFVSITRAADELSIVCLERNIPGDARCIAYLETCDPGEYLDATPPSGVEVVWLHRPEPGSQPRLLADALLAGPWPSGRADVFAHGERESMKAVRAALKARLGDNDQLSLSGYWASGRTEDVFQAEKREPIGQV